MKDPNEKKLDLEPNSKPYLLKRLISDGFDTVLIFVLFMILSALIFQTPLANTYNSHYENYKKIEDGVKAEYEGNAEAITEKLNGDAAYRDERFAANLHSYLLKILAGFIAEAVTLLIIPLISKTRGTPGRIMTGLIPLKEKKQIKAPALTVLARFAFIFIIDSVIPYLFTGILTFILIPVIRLVEMLLNKKNKTVCDALTGIMVVEKLSYDGIDKNTEEKS